jgi:glc operon protein GlcG
LHSALRNGDNVIARNMLGLGEAQRAISAVVREAEKDRQPMSVAVTDSDGELIACFRMDGSHPRILRHAIRKAFTSGVMHRSTLEFKRQGRERELDLDDWGDARLTTLQGGLPVRYNGEVVGAIGVGGNTIERDSEVCSIAVAAAIGES